MKNLKKGQISIEYLILAGFVAFLIIAVLGVALLYVDKIRDTMRFNELQNFANKVISSSENVYYSGEPSKITFNAYLPAGIRNMEIIGNELVFNVSTSSGEARISFRSNVPIEVSGSLGFSEGLKILQVEASQDKVILREA